MSEPVTTWPRDSVDLYKGEVVTFKGKLAAVRYGDAGGARRGIPRTDRIGDRWQAGIVLTFADWSMVAINVWNSCTARSIRTPLSSHVTIKARVIDEDGTLEAIAIWTPGGAPLPLAPDYHAAPV